MKQQVCDASKLGGQFVIFVALSGLLLCMGRNSFASVTRQSEWVVVQGIACVDANRDNACEANEPKVARVIVRGDGVELAQTDATGRFSVRVLAQSVIEFEVPSGYESTMDSLGTQVFESGRIDVPLRKLEAPIATRVAPTATTAPDATATTAAAATGKPSTSAPSASPTSAPITTSTARPISTNTPTPKPTLTPEASATLRPSDTASPVLPTQTPSAETPAPTALAAATAEATATEQATATETASATPLPTETASPTETPAVALALNNDATAQAPTPTAEVMPLNPDSGFGEESQPASRFSFSDIPRIYVLSVVVLLAVALLLGWLVYRANALKTSALTAASPGGFAPQTMVWETGSSHATMPLPSGAEWHPIAERLISHTRLKSISVDAEAGILAASIMPMPVFMLAGKGGARLVFTIDPSLPVRSGLVADRSQIISVAKLHGMNRSDVHALWNHVARVRNLPNASYPTWADWYLLVC